MTVPDFLPAEAGELIDAQYADRPRLRPILDAVLAVLPEIGEVTVQARKTIVSLVSPRRTFAVVQAATRSRVDLGVRLDDQQPEGRLLKARDLGAANLRIALADPEDVDQDAIGLLRRAYEQSVAPPKPRRRPEPRPHREKLPLRVVIEGFDLPGRSFKPWPDMPAYGNVHIALPAKSTDRPGLVVPDRRWQATEPVPGNAGSARWELEINVLRGEGEFDFSGSFVAGDRTDRNLGLAWGDVPEDGTFRLFRGVKLRLVDIDPEVIKQALEPGHYLLARVRLTDMKGNPICARLRPPDIVWTAPKAP